MSEKDVENIVNQRKRQIKRMINGEKNNKSVKGNEKVIT